MPSSRRRRLVLGALALLAALAINKWSLEILFSRDLRITDLVTLGTIWGFQLVATVFGAWLIIGRPQLPRPLRVAVDHKVLGPALMVALVGATAFGAYVDVTAYGLLRNDREMLRPTAEMVMAEEVIAELRPHMRGVARALRNLSLPDRSSPGLWSDEVEVIDLEAGHTQLIDKRLALQQTAMHAADRTAGSPQELELWSQLFADVAWIDSAETHVASGEFLDEARLRFRTLVDFEALAQLLDGRSATLRGEIRIGWQRDAPGAAWRIELFETIELEQLAAASSLFRDVIPEVLPDPATLQAATRSLHDELTADSIRSNVAGERNRFSIAPTLVHPSVAVVDIDADGWDDLYFMPAWGKNLLLRNRGDGTFEDVAPALGLDLEGTVAALFADYDNDGDADVFISAGRDSARYLRNDAGRFVDRSVLADGAPLPRQVTSMSVADFDGDGLLDVYMATYAAGPVDLSVGARLLTSALEGAERPGALNRGGPPNVLLRNVDGSNFERVGEETIPTVRRWSFQGTWGDFDADGDADLYVANDYAPDNLLENRAGRLVDISEAAGIDRRGFGMGASWGDFDQDGWLDLYITNMSSHSGARITARFPQLPEAYKEAARGNWLLRSVTNPETAPSSPVRRFEKVSSIDGTGYPVQEAGWGWGSQFVDLDNDGDLDIYAPAGYYTAPPSVATDVDT